MPVANFSSVTVIMSVCAYAKLEMLTPKGRSAILASRRSVCFIFCPFAINSANRGQRQSRDPKRKIKADLSFQ